MFVYVHKPRSSLSVLSLATNLLKRTLTPPVLYWAFFDRGRTWPELATGLLGGESGRRCPVRSGDPGYGSHLDHDGDTIGWE